LIGKKGKKGGRQRVLLRGAELEEGAEEEEKEEGNLLE
jgi:hypothetical protein